MATITDVSITYEGRHSKGMFLTIESAVAAVWEAVTDPDGLLPGIYQGSGEAIQFVRPQVPVLKAEQGPLAGSNLVAEYSGAAGEEAWETAAQAGGALVPVFQAICPVEEVGNVFFVEYGRKHSRTR
jgi:hypothetical protein